MKPSLIGDIEKGWSEDHDPNGCHTKEDPTSQACQPDHVDLMRGEAAVSEGKDASTLAHDDQRYRNPRLLTNMVTGQLPAQDSEGWQ